jgi:lysophospholipase L1-like esterase
VTGADMADLLGQVQQAVTQQVEYVTVLMGANDVCASSESAMTPVATFRAQFEQAMAALAAGLPNARVFVASIPNVYNLFAIYRSSVAAQSVWTLAGICQSMLANAWSNFPWDVARRNRVRQRNIDYNTQLAQVCALYVTCRFDNNAVFNTPFVRSDVTTRDYFHPSVAGQAKLAAVTWAATFDFASG